MAGNTQILARLGVVMTANSAEFKQGMDEGILATQKLKRAITSEFTAAQKEIDRLSYAAKDFGKSLSEVDKINRQLSEGGKLSNIAGSEKAQELLFRAAAYDKVAAAQKKQGETAAKAAGLTAFQLQQLSYQTTDIFTSLAGGQSPLLVLIQQGGQLKDSFGGVANVFKAFAQVLTPMRLLLGGVATAIGGLAFAAYKGNEEFKQFNNSLILTGQYAGITYEKYKAMSAGIAVETGTSIGSVKEIYNQMIASGKLTQSSMASVGKTIALVARLSGESAADVAKNLIPAFASGAKGVFELNKQFHFLTLTQYKQIEALEKQSKSQEIAKLGAEAYSKNLDDNVEKVGLLTKALNLLKNAWDSLQQFGAGNSLNEQIENQKKNIEALEKTLNQRARQVIDTTDSSTQKKLESARTLLAQLEKQQKDVNTKSINKQKESEIEAAYEKAGAIHTLDNLRYQNIRAISDAEFEKDVFNVDKLTRIELEGYKKIRDLKADQTKALEEAGASQLHKNAINVLYNTKEKAAKAEIVQKIQEANNEEYKSFQDRYNLSELQINSDKAKLEILQKNINASEIDIQNALSRLEIEQEIKRINENRSLTLDAKLTLLIKAKELQISKDGVASALKLLEVSRDTARSIQDRQKSEKDSLQMEEEKLAIYSKNVLISDKDMNIALSKLQAEQEIAKIRKLESENKLTPEMAKAAIEEEQNIQRRREGILELSDNLKTLKDIHNSVFQNMETAITNFVKTGKLSFKDLAGSIIQDIIAIQLKAQATKLFGNSGSFWDLFKGGSASPSTGFGGMTTAGPMSIMTAANGAEINGPTVVGEAGPELFIPKGAGTVIPNTGMGDSMSKPQIIYNGPYIASMSAIDTQSATQFLARNKLAVYSANASASRSLPTSR